VLLAPVYLVHEYLIRRPLGALVTRAERGRWADSVQGLFSVNAGDTLLAPTGRFDLGLLPSVGLYVTSDHLLARGNSVRLYAATWGRPWIDVTAADRYSYDHGDGLVEGRFELRRTEDNLFVGIGPDATSATRARFGLERIEGSVAFVRRLAGASMFRATAGVHRIAFVGGTCCDDPSLDSEIASGAVMAPPGYGTAYTAFFGRAEIALDTRRPRPEPGDGVYVRVTGDTSATVDDRVWIRYGADAGAAYDLTGHRRIVTLRAAVELVDPLHGQDVPFVELASAGGDLMPAFVPGWMIGRSTAAAQLGYTWPVWLWLDGQARVSVGNAFDAHLRGFDPAKLRLSADLGITMSRRYDLAFEVLAGIGTETFEQGGGITSVRVTVGSRRAF